MKQRIIESNKVNKKGHIYTIYNGFWDYISTKFWLFIVLLPFFIIFWICKYTYLFFKFIVNKLSSFIMKKNDKINKRNSYIISIIILFAVGIIFCLFPINKKSNIKNDYIENTISNGIIESTNNYSLLNDFVQKYNNISNNNITDIVYFDVADKNNSHYKTEYRLLDDAEAITGLYNNSQIDIVYDKIHKNIRIYNTSNRECIKDILLNISKILNCDVDENEINKLFVNNYNSITKLGNKGVNGYIDGNKLFIEFSY